MDRSIAKVEKLDVPLIPGGADATIWQALEPEVLDWVRKIDQISLYTTSVCTGAWIVGKAGPLDGCKASTHWFRAEQILEKFGADYTGKRWTRDGKYWTSAGVTAGIDMALALICEWYSKDFT